MKLESKHPIFVAIFEVDIAYIILKDHSEVLF